MYSLEIPRGGQLDGMPSEKSSLGSNLELAVKKLVFEGKKVTIVVRSGIVTPVWPFPAWRVQFQQSAFTQNNTDLAPRAAGITLVM